MTHICVSDLTSIGSDNGLSPGRRQAIIRTNAGKLLIRPLGTNFSEFLVEILIFSFKKMRLKVSSGKRRPFCLGLNELTHYISELLWIDSVPVPIWHQQWLISFKECCSEKLHYRRRLIEMVKILQLKLSVALSWKIISCILIQISFNFFLRDELTFSTFSGSDKPLPEQWWSNSQMQMIRCICVSQSLSELTHQGIKWCIYASENKAIIGSDNGLSRVRHQAIFWTSAGLLLIAPWETKFNDILIGNLTFSFKKIHLKMSTAKWWAFCLSLNVLNRDQSRYAPSQWEISLHCNDISHWLGTYLDWSLVKWMVSSTRCVHVSQQNGHN